MKTLVDCFYHSIISIVAVIVSSYVTSSEEDVFIAAVVVGVTYAGITDINVDIDIFHLLRRQDVY